MINSYSFLNQAIKLPVQSINSAPPSRGGGGLAEVAQRSAKAAWREATLGGAGMRTPVSHLALDHLCVLPEELLQNS